MRMMTRMRFRRVVAQAIEVPVGKIRVVIADDHQAVTAEVRRMIIGQCEIVAVAEDGKQAVAAVLNLDPDILIVDISMPVMDGLEAVKQLQKANCRARI